MYDMRNGSLLLADIVRQKARLICFPLFWSVEGLVSSLQISLQERIVRIIILF